MTDAERAVHEHRFQMAAYWFSLFLCVAAVVVGAMAWSNSGDQNSMIYKHYPAIVGLPWAAAAGFIIVTLFRQVAGPIKIKGWGLDIEGAGGPVLLWVACFMAMTTAIWMVWDLKP